MVIDEQYSGMNFHFETARSFLRATETHQEFTHIAKPEKKAYHSIIDAEVA